MLWLVKDSESHEIISCNIHVEEGIYSVWVTRPNGKNLKIHESKDEQDVKIIKEAIDYAIEKGESVLRLA